MYNNFLGFINEPTEDQKLLIDERSKLFVNPSCAKEYDTVRFGIPSGTIKFDEVIEERKLLVTHFLNHGYDNWPYSKLSAKFRRHVALFRANLDFWEVFSKSKVFCKDEIYFRCLTEGHTFAETVKKTRSTCYRAFTSETDNDVEEQYYSEAYDGYNSILHERYLIHWDDTHVIDDIKYCFMPVGQSRKYEFQRLLNEMWDDFRLDELEWPDEFDMLASLKNTRMYDPVTKKSSLMREFWDSGVDPRGPYFAKRTVVPTEPGTTRDTGVGDPGTILKVKQLNALARIISEKLPYSANAPAHTANGRLKRVLKRDMFLHLDFKKFGLTFPRELMNVLIEKIQESSGLDLDHLIIRQFYVEIDKEVYSTSRGTMLGWLDSINSICVSAILHRLAKDLKFDFITFNDDVEISKRGSEYKDTLELLRAAVLSTIDFFDIPISINKTFGSRASVFLERYAYYDRYNIDMYKEQLTVKAYARSCVASHPWQAKLLFAAADQWTKSTYARDRCIDTCPVEFRKVENTLPLWSGGWYIRRKNGLDLALKESDDLGNRLGLELQKFKPPRYATKPEKVSDNNRIYTCVNNKALYSTPGDSYLHRNNLEVENLREVNHEIDYIYSCIETRVDLYSGRDEKFPRIVLDIVQKQCRGWDPFA